MNAAPDLLAVVTGMLKLSMVVMVGLYFIFSNTIMRSLGAFSQGAQVMVEINKVILNPVFMTCFLVSGAASLYFVFAGENLLRVSGLVFFVGTTLVTVVKNVPLNNALRDAQPSDQQRIWQLYLDKWVWWNHVRSASAVIAGFLLVV